jgi:hypothetical protein
VPAFDTGVRAVGAKVIVPGGADAVENEGNHGNRTTIVIEQQ